MSLGRFLLPTLPLQTIALIATIAGIKSMFGKTQFLRIALPAVLTLLNIPPWCGQYLSSPAIREAFHFRWNKEGYISEMDHWKFMKSNTSRWQLQAKAIAMFTQPGESLIVGPIGNLGYFTQLHLYDCFGLASKLDRNVMKGRHLRSPGHDMRVPPEYFLDQEPTYFAAKMNHASRMGALYKRKRSYPRQYAPVAYRVPRSLAGNEDLFLVLFKRFPSRKDAYKQWEMYKSDYGATERKK